MDRFDSVLPHRVTNEEQIESPQRHVNLPYVNVGKLIGATPSVQGLQVCTSDGGASKTLKNAMNGQTVWILGDGTTSIICATGDIVLVTDKMNPFTYLNGVWYQGV